MKLIIVLKSVTSNVPMTMGVSTHHEYQSPGWKIMPSKSEMHVATQSMEM